MSYENKPGYGICLRILSGVFMAGMYVSVKRSVMACRWVRSYFSARFLPSYRWLCFYICAMSFLRGWIVSHGNTLYLLIVAGLFGGFAHIALTLSFRYAEASRLAPFEYIALLWPLLADMLIFRLSLTSGFLLAAPLVLAGAAVAAMEGGSQTYSLRR